MKKTTAKFHIDHMDPLGQGVSKSPETGQITFIKKTLPSEQGLAQVFRHKGKVQFAELEQLSQVSDKRIEPACPHFSQCSGCHYLHTDYVTELGFKQANFQRELQRIGYHRPVEIKAALNRLHYRNRIQLHYDLFKQKLGLLDAKDHNILPVPNCMLPNALVQAELQRLYQNEHWISLVQKLAPKQKQGHIEIYDRNGQIQTSINQHYAYGGFEQVYPAMNQMLLTQLKVHYDQLPQSDKQGLILDLFGGQGNLSKAFNQQACLVVDTVVPENIAGSHQTFLGLDLYDKQALQQLKKQMSKLGLNSDQACSLMIVDPPRSGLKNLAEFVACFKPQHLLYVSCHWSTMLRDIASIHQKGHYSIGHAEIFDFFPATYHFETYLMLTRQ